MTNNKGEGRGGLKREGGFITFLPLERRGLLERENLFGRAGGLIGDLQFTVLKLFQLTGLVLWVS